MNRFALGLVACLIIHGEAAGETPPRVAPPAANSLITVAEPLPVSPPRIVVAEPLGWDLRLPRQERADEDWVRVRTSPGSTHLQFRLGANFLPAPIVLERLDDPPRVFFHVAHDGPLAKPSIDIRTAEVERVRFGLHQAAGRTSVRYVIDLGSRRVEIASVEVVDGELLIEARRGVVTATLER